MYFSRTGVLELLQARWRTDEFEFVIELVEVMLNHFVDEESGAFCFTSDDHEPLLYRSVPSHDDSTPSGNGLAAHILIRLGYLTGENRYLETAQKILQALQPAAMHMPSSFGASLVAIEDLINPGTIVIIRGAQDEIDHWASACATSGPVNMMVFAIPNDADGLPGQLAEKSGGEFSPVAYICSGFTCLPPYHSIDELTEKISKRIYIENG